MNQEKYIGMDVHQATISVAVMDSSGKLIMERKAGPLQEINSNEPREIRRSRGSLALTES
jgi:hypothetical protein